MELYLTPAAIGYLAQLILALLITGYLVYRAVAHRRRGASNAHNRARRSFHLSGGIPVEHVGGHLAHPIPVRAGLSQLHPT